MDTNLRSSCILLALLTLAYFVYAQRYANLEDQQDDEDPFVSLLGDVEHAIIPGNSKDMESGTGTWILSSVFTAILSIFLTIVSYFKLVITSPINFVGRIISFVFILLFSVILYIFAPILLLLQGILTIFFFWPYALLHWLADTLYPLYVFCGVAAVFGFFSGGLGGTISQSVISLLVGTRDDRYPKHQREDSSQSHRPVVIPPLRLRGKSSSSSSPLDIKSEINIRGQISLEKAMANSSLAPDRFSDSDFDDEDWSWREQEESNEL